MRIIDWFGYKFFKDKQLMHPIAIDFYRMLKKYDTRYTNIAVFQNKRKYDALIRTYRDRLNPKREDIEIMASDKKHIFIIDELETTIVLLDSLDDLDFQTTKFGKFM